MDLLDSLKKYTEFSMGMSNEMCELIYEDTCFEDVIFTGYDLNNSKFLEVQFNKCNFSKVYMSGASLCGSLFNKCVFEDNIFKKGMADHARFLKSDIKGMDAFRSSFYETKFEDMKISDSLIKNCHLGRAKFMNVIFENTDLSKTNFNNSVFNKVIFKNCFFADTQFKDILGYEEINFFHSSIMINGVPQNLLGNEIKDIII